MNKINDVTRLDNRDGIAVLEIDFEPVNALGYSVRQGIETGLQAALRDPAVDAIVIACAGRTFCAGADIAEFGKPIRTPVLNDILAIIDAADKPVVAAIHGTALGGGLELTLACHHRIADPKTRIAFPEVNLGLLPGGGGTQRTPRLAGVEAALDLIVSGRMLTADAGVKAGLIDSLSEPGQLRADAIAIARKLADGAMPMRRARDLPLDVSGDDAARLIEDFVRRNGRVFKGFKAPGHIVKAIEAAIALPFDEGVRREWELFEELLASDESAAQRHIFFAERATGKVPGLSRDTKTLPIGSVAIIGAGTMGTGISLAFLNAGFAVRLIDLNAEALDRAAKKISATIQGQVDKGRIHMAEAERRKAALSVASSTAAAGEADLIVEAVFERMDLKQSVFREIDRVAKPGAILASNTSFLDLDALAAVTGRPKSVVGLHFFAPANIMRLLEVVRGKRTSDAIVATAMELGRKLGKVAILSGVCDGFIANRLMARRGEAADRLILEGPMPWDVDAAMTAFGFPMGVFAMLDLVGVDVIGWDREASAGRTVQEVLCEAGRLGQKAGAGYYDYDAKRKAQLSAVVADVVRSFQPNADEKHYDRQQIIEELLDPVVNEGAKLLEEGIALKASDIDMALVTGYGWPVTSGGPMFWGDRVGLAAIVNRLRERQAAGNPIVISQLLERLASTGGSLTQD